MKCDFCPEKATVFLTQLVDNEVKKMCLCESCAEEKGVSDPTGFSLADVLLGGGKVPETGEIVNLPETGGDQVCPSCGFTLAKFQQVGRLGCSSCYTTFHEEIAGRLKGMHKGIKHVGRVPEHLADAHHRQQQLKALNEELEKAIREENYEEAAGLRDRIADIQTDAKVES